MQINKEELAERTKVVQHFQVGTKKNELSSLLKQLEDRRKYYWILDAKMDRIPKQKELFEDMVKRLESPIQVRKRFYLYYWGNGAWKTFVGAYLTVLMALGYDTKKYNLPFIGVIVITISQSTLRVRARNSLQTSSLVFLAQDDDDNVYIFDEIRIAETDLKEIARQVNEKSRGYNFECFVRDSAAKREWLEFEKQYGIYTIPADKRSKGANDMSNRRTWILLMNTGFKAGKIWISDRCQMLIRELETHYYKENGRRDGEVNKEDDDCIDALRYVYFMLKYNIKPKSRLLIDKFKKKNNPRSVILGFSFDEPFSTTGVIDGWFLYSVFLTIVIYCKYRK